MTIEITPKLIHELADISLLEHINSQAEEKGYVEFKLEAGGYDYYISYTRNIANQWKMSSCVKWGAQETPTR